MSATPWTLCDPHGLYSPWNSPGQNTGVGNCFLLQGIFQTQGSNPGLPHCRHILYQLSHGGKPKKTGMGSLSLLQWIFLTQESNWGLLHCRWILTSRATREVCIVSKIFFFFFIADKARDFIGKECPGGEQ